MYFRNLNLFIAIILNRNQNNRLLIERWLKENYHKVNKEESLNLSRRRTFSDFRFMPLWQRAYAVKTIHKNNTHLNRTASPENMTALHINTVTVWVNSRLLLQRVVLDQELNSDCPVLNGCWTNVIDDGPAFIRHSASMWFSCDARPNSLMLIIQNIPKGYIGDVLPVIHDQTSNDCWRTNNNMYMHQDRTFIIQSFNHWTAVLFVSIFHSFEAGIANAISSFKWMKNSIMYEK